MSEAEPDKLLDDVREWLTTQGYKLEYEAARRLRAAGLDTRQGRTYRDESTGKTRDVDVLAELLHPALRPPQDHVHVFGVVECKWATGPWIVRKAAVLDSEERQAWPIATGRLGGDIAGKFFPLFQGPSPMGFAIDQKRTRGAANEAHDTFLQVVSAARGLVNDEKRQAVFHPIVLVGGPLLSLWYEGDGEPRLSRSEWERVVWSGAPDLPHPVAVDVVTRSALVDYARVLVGQLTELQDYATRYFAR